MSRLTGRARRIAVPGSVAALLVALLAVSGTALVIAGRGPASPASTSAPVAASTVTVVRTDLSDRRTYPGTLGFGPATTVVGRGGGTVTEVPPTGRVTARGKALYRVDDQPVPVLYGRTPLFRTLELPTPASPTTPAPPPQAPTRPSTSAAGRGPGGEPATGPVQAPAGKQTQPYLRGRDVTVVADNLRALGYDIGHRADGSDVYTPALAAAVKRWQKRVGMTATGRLRVGQVVVLPGRARVASVTARLGDAVDEPLLTVTSTEKVVTVPVEVGSLGRIGKGAPVTIEMPDSSTIAAAVASVTRSLPADPGGTGGTGESGGSDDAGAPQQTVTIRPRRAGDVADLDAAGVQVAFSTGRRHGVLAVPVSALLALSGGGYALQRVDGSLLAVRTGLFADGLVEVSGAGLTPGLRVQAAS
jgi:Putative peptidoglycan binding domain